MAEQYEPGTKGHTLAFGSEGNTWSFDVDTDGNIVNLQPANDNTEVAAIKAEAEALVEDDAAEPVAEADNGTGDAAPADVPAEN